MSTRYASQGPQRGAGPGAMGLGLLLLLVVVGGYGVYTSCIVDVPTRHVLVRINKTGKDLANDLELAPDEQYKGVQLALLSEGRHFLNPYQWDWEVIPYFEVPDGKLGVRVRLHGDDLPYGEFLTRSGEQKGIVPGTLRAGRYPINPYAERVELYEPVTVPAGFKGVVTSLAGPLAPDPNVLLVEPGQRGVQAETLDPETYYDVNPYEKRVTLVDCRSQRHNLSEEKDMGFPTKDGFWVSIDGVIEFRVKPEAAALVFVTYNEDSNGDRIDEEIRDKIIIPNARSISRLHGSNSLGREIMQGETRAKFQEHFQQAMREACDPLGVEIIQALITRIRPPEQIAKPVRDREIAKQQEKQFLQQILQQASEKQLAVEKELINQRQTVVRAEQEVIRVTTEALQKQEVAVTQAKQMLAVAELKLQAAKDEAAALLSRGKAAAEVVEFNNAAEAAGWKRAVEAFGGDGQRFARYVLLGKLAPAYRSIMANTADSPIMDIFKAFNAHDESPAR